MSGISDATATATATAEAFPCHKGVAEGDASTATASTAETQALKRHLVVVRAAVRIQRTVSMKV